MAAHVMLIYMLPSEGEFTFFYNRLLEQTYEILCGRTEVKEANTATSNVCP